MIVKTSGLFLIRKDGKLLLGHPTKHPSNFWSIPKGKVESNETDFEALIRETYEETNIVLNKNVKYVILDSVKYKHGKKKLMPFLIEEKDNPDLSLDNQVIKCNSCVPEERGGFPEMDDYKFVSLEEAEKIIHYTQSACIPKIKEIIGER